VVPTVVVAAVFFVLDAGALWFDRRLARRSPREPRPV
jgi:hypothetical protein